MTKVLSKYKLAARDTNGSRPIRIDSEFFAFSFFLHSKIWSPNFGLNLLFLFSILTLNLIYEFN